MPKSSRRPTAKQRTLRRRRRETGPVQHIQASFEESPDLSLSLSSPPQSAAEAVAMPPPAAVAPRAARATAPIRAVHSTTRQDPFLTTELRRIAVMSAFILAILIALTVFLR